MYDFTDITPVHGTAFYRVLQKNKDGNFTYSAVVVIADRAWQLSAMHSYPNPVSDQLNAVVNITGVAQMATISIRDVSGRVISKINKQLITGSNNVEINISKQAGNVYLLIMELPSGERLISKFVKK